MTDKEINSATIAAFIARAINIASANAMDADFGLRVLQALVHQTGRDLYNVVQVELQGGHSVTVTIEHRVPRTPTEQTKGTPANASR